ncbi:isoprenyl transferase [Paenibacillus alkalitolerans]|uniref:isoprenyl transferase n=1 Tax=Paenibacillus alkalitolerans TaxID=2799335 RepID=UPI0018F6568E|nr:isoprenyl transferase [Paenibacillus alkalitolerans]
MLSQKELEPNSYPGHIAIMMDGNGRWATKRGLPRTAGHLAGMETMRRIIQYSNELGIKHLTLYAFSSENWKRPQQEVDYILSLPNKFLDTKTQNELDRNNVKISFIGDLSKFSTELLQTISNIEERTKNNNGMTVNFALNYGGKTEIINAAKKLLTDGINPDQIDQEIFENYLYTKGQPTPDLIIRTSGERRLSNFLLWQSANAELWFTDTLWPDFSKELLIKAINDFKERKTKKT